MRSRKVSTDLVYGLLLLIDRRRLFSFAFFLFLAGFGSASKIPAGLLVPEQVSESSLQSASKSSVSDDTPLSQNNIHSNFGTFIPSSSLSNPSATYLPSPNLDDQSTSYPIGLVADYANNGIRRQSNRALLPLLRTRRNGDIAARARQLALWKRADPPRIMCGSSLIENLKEQCGDRGTYSPNRKRSAPNVRTQSEMPSFDAVAEIETFQVFKRYDNLCSIYLQYEPDSPVAQCCCLGCTRAYLEGFCAET